MTTRARRHLGTSEPPRPPRRRSAFRRPLLAAVIVAALLTILWTAPEPALDAIVDTADAARPHATDHFIRLVTSIAAIALVGLGFVVAWGAASSPGRPVRLAGGRGTMQVGALAEQFADILCERDDIDDARVEVENRHRRGIAVIATIEVTPDARLAEVVPAAAALIEATARYHLDVALASAPAIRVHYRELRLRPRPYRGGQHAPLPADGSPAEADPLEHSRLEHSRRMVTPGEDA